MSFPAEESYTGPYQTGDEIELQRLEELDKKIDAMFNGIDESE